MSDRDDAGLAHECAATRTDICVGIILPHTRSGAEHVEESIRSILTQDSDGWELCICNSGTTPPATRAVIEKYRGCDSRIKIIAMDTVPDRMGPANWAATFTSSNLIAIVEPGDTLADDAVGRLVQAVSAAPDADLVYTDEEVGTSRKAGQLYLKPDWSPEHLLSTMYLGRWLVIRKSLYLSLGGLREAYADGAAYDLALRAADAARRVLHVPSVLYRRREALGGALDGEKRALTDFVTTFAADAKVVDGLVAGSYRVKWPLDPTRPVTILIPTAARRRVLDDGRDVLLVEHAIDSIIKRSSFRAFQIIVLDDGDLPPDVAERFVLEGVRVERYVARGPFNFAAKMNYGLNFVRSEDVILLNDDVEVIAPDWIEALLELSRQPAIGAVGAKLLYLDGRIQHAGIVLGIHNSAEHIFRNLPDDEPGYGGFASLIRNYSAVTGAVIATRMSVLAEVGNFDEKLAADFNDIDWCLRVGAAGYRIAYTPFAKLYHFECSSRGLARDGRFLAEMDYFRARWRAKLGKDPYYNPNLPKDHALGETARDLEMSAAPMLRLNSVGKPDNGRIEPFQEWRADLKPALWVDVQDLFDFAVTSRRLSGIQRLSFELCRALQQEYGDSGRIHFMRHNSRRDGFARVAWADVAALMTDLTAGDLNSARLEPAFEGVAPPVASDAATARPRSTGPLRSLARSLPYPLRHQLHVAVDFQIKAISALADLFKLLVPATLRDLRGSTNSAAGPVVAMVAEAADEPIQPRRGDYIFSPGSPWPYLNYADRIRSAKLRHGLRYACVVFDLVPIRHPEWCVPGQSAQFLHWFRSVLPLADRLFAISNSTAWDAERFATEAAVALTGPILTMPIGTGLRDEHPAGVPNSARLPAPGTYVLFVSTIEARKNHQLLLRVWRRMLAECPRESVPTMVFAGRVGWLVGDLMRQLENCNYLDGKIRVIEGPSDAELSSLYRGCLFTVYPSLFEGWGLPVSESLALGVPCVASNSTSIPEAGGTLVRYFDPDSVSEAYEVILGAIASKDDLDAWRTKISTEFVPVPWSASAHAVMEALEAMAVEHKPR